MQPFIISYVLLTAAVGAYAQTKDPAEAAALVSKLLTAPTQVARFDLLNDTDVSLQLKRFRVVLTDDVYSLFSTLRPA
jgi:hypothetical protein